MSDIGPSCVNVPRFWLTGLHDLKYQSSLHLVTLRAFSPLIYLAHWFILQVANNDQQIFTKQVLQLLYTLFTYRVFRP